MPPQAATPSTQSAPETAVEKQIRRAKELDYDGQLHLKKVAANREYLRLMAANDELSEDQLDWLEDFYPTKEKGERRTEEERKRSDEVRTAARAEIKAARGD